MAEVVEWFFNIDQRHSRGLCRPVGDEVGLFRAVGRDDDVQPKTRHRVSVDVVA